MAELLDISMAEYLASERLAKTDLCTLLDETPRHFQARQSGGGGDEETESMFAGSLRHAMTLEPRRVGERYVVEPDTTRILKKDGTRYASPRSTQAYKALTFKRLADKPGAQVVTRPDWKAAGRTAKALRAHPVFRKLLGPEPLCEQTIYFDEEYQDASGEVQVAQMKTRPDAHHVTDDRVAWVDLKSTRRAHRVAWGTQANTLRYHVGAYLQSKGLWLLYGKPVLGLAFAFELGPLIPHAVYCYTGNKTMGELWTPRGPQSLAMQMGQSDTWEALNIWLTCTRAHRWPSYNDGKVVEVWTPPWRKREFENETLAAAEEFPF